MPSTGRSEVDHAICSQHARRHVLVQDGKYRRYWVRPEHLSIVDLRVDAQDPFPVLRCEVDLSVSSKNSRYRMEPAVLDVQPGPHQLDSVLCRIDAQDPLGRTRRKVDVATGCGHTLAGVGEITPEPWPQQLNSLGRRVNAQDLRRTRWCEVDLAICNHPFGLVLREVVAMHLQTNSLSNLPRRIYAQGPLRITRGRVYLAVCRQYPVGARAWGLRHHQRARLLCCRVYAQNLPSSRRIVVDCAIRGDHTGLAVSRLGTQQRYGRALHADEQYAARG
mmetsp:Transcript_53020/g.106422  ORF Transcript_53020/g.106422 Transcript_53020/m.106422 type:complete len:277 (+) Transcript_53020:324-1154(+)